MGFVTKQTTHESSREFQKLKMPRPRKNTNKQSNDTIRKNKCNTILNKQVKYISKPSRQRKPLREKQSIKNPRIQGS